MLDQAAEKKREGIVTELVLWAAMVAVVGVCAAGSYEHVVIVPQWTEAPPASIAMLHGPYAIDTGRWWRVVHAPALLLSVGALALLRKDARRRSFVAAAVAGYAAVLVATFVWYLPELIALTGDPHASIPAFEWKVRADRWEALSIARLVAMYVIAACLLRVAVAAHSREKPVAASD